MTEVPEVPADGGQPTVEQAALSADASTTGATPPVPPAAAPVALPADRPELAVGAAFAGGIALALFLKRLGRYAPTPDPIRPDPTLAETITQVSERASLLVREEIELAKAEITARVTKLIKGAVVGIVAGVFLITGLFFLLNSAAWGAYLFFGESAYWAGFLVVAVALFILGALAGWLAARALKAGAPPTPDMAIDEAKKIRETVTEAGS